MKSLATNSAVTVGVPKVFRKKPWRKTKFNSIPFVVFTSFNCVTLGSTTCDTF